MYIYIYIYIYFSARFIVPLLYTEEKDKEEDTMIHGTLSSDKNSRICLSMDREKRSSLLEHEDYLEGYIIRDCYSPRITKTRHPFC